MLPLALAQWLEHLITYHKIESSNPGLVCYWQNKEIGANIQNIFAFSGSLECFRAIPTETFTYKSPLGKVQTRVKASER